MLLTFKKGLPIHGVVLCGSSAQVHWVNFTNPLTGKKDQIPEPAGGMQSLEWDGESPHLIINGKRKLWASPQPRQF